MPPKVIPAFDKTRELVLERIERIYDPVPPWILENQILYTKYAQLAAKFAARKLKIERDAIDLELERANAMVEFYTKGIR